MHRIDGARRVVNGNDERFLTGEVCERLRHDRRDLRVVRPEEHTSELQSLMRSSYAVFCLKKKNHSYECPLHLSHLTRNVLVDLPLIHTTISTILLHLCDAPRYELQ